MANHKVKHGHARRTTGKSRTYRSWQSMMDRCYNTNHKNYSLYGGNGVRVCDDWHDFKVFLKDMGVRPLNRSIDRHPPDSKIYSKLTCRWANKSQQGFNRILKSKHSTKYRGVSFDGKSKTNPFTAQIHKSNRKIHLGRFPTAEAAALAFNRAASDLFNNVVILNEVSL